MIGTSITGDERLIATGASERSTPDLRSGSSASASSRAVAKRALGSFSRQRSTVSSSSGGSAGFKLRGGAGALTTMS